MKSRGNMNMKRITAIVMVLIMCMTISMPTEAATKRKGGSLQHIFRTMTIGRQNYTTRRKVEVIKTPDASDWRYMTSIIYCEARGESFESQKAVGIVVMNRVKSDLFPNSVYDVIYERGQFTPTRNGSMNRALNLYDQQTNSGQYAADMASCRKAALYVLNDVQSIMVNGEDFDMSSYLYFSNYLRGARFTLGRLQFK